MRECEECGDGNFRDILVRRSIEGKVDRTRNIEACVSRGEVLQMKMVGCCSNHVDIATSVFCKKLDRLAYVCECYSCSHYSVWHGE